MRMFRVLAVVAAISGAVMVATPAAAQMGGPSGVQEKLRSLQKEREEVVGYLRTYWVRNPLSMTCAMIGLGTAGSAILEQVDDQFRAQLDDRMRGMMIIGGGACALYCIGSDQAQCGDAVVFLGKVGMLLGMIAKRERELSSRY